jgi:hypothetical protein
MSTEEDIKRNYSNVTVEGWGTAWRHTPHNFKAHSGIVHHGPTRSLETDFAALTDKQKAVLRVENLHYFIREAQNHAQETWAEERGLVIVDPRNRT